MYEILTEFEQYPLDYHAQHDIRAPPLYGLHVNNRGNFIMNAINRPKMIFVLSFLLFG